MAVQSIFKKPKLNFPLTARDAKSLQDFIDGVTYKLSGNLSFIDFNAETSATVQDAYDRSVAANTKAEQALSAVTKAYTLNYREVRTLNGTSSGTFTITLPTAFKGKPFIAVARFETAYSTQVANYCTQRQDIKITKDQNAGTVTVAYNCSFNYINSGTLTACNVANNYVEIAVDVIG